MKALALLGALFLTASAAHGQSVKTPTSYAASIKKALSDSGFSGYALVARDEATLYDGWVSFCPQFPSGIVMCDPPGKPGERRWPWASVSKQMAAIVTLQQVERSVLRLDDPIGKWITLPGKLPSPTVRQLLQHRAGLRNSNETPIDEATGLPSFYSGDGTAEWCLHKRGAPGGAWSYNNCDYIVLDAVLKRAAGRSVKQLFEDGIARPLGLKRAGYLDAASDPNERLGKRTASLFAGWGAAGSLAGPPHELLKIDRALLAGKLLKPESRRVLWEGDPALGYMALGQWSFEAGLKGCAKPMRVIERRGAIDVTQVRNFILPDRGIVVILFTHVGEDRFDFGEIWQGKGPSHNILSAVACT